MPLDDTNWTSDDTAQVATGSGTGQRRQGGERPPLTETDETAALLIRARAFVKRGWCQGELALDVEGNPVNPRSEWAVSWCMSGALIAAGVDELGHSAFRRLSDAISRFSSFIPAFNDHQETVEPILAAFDRAIAAGDP